jgi:hypothetical protein
MRLHVVLKLDDLGTLATVQEELAVLHLFHHGILIRLLLREKVLHDLDLDPFLAECVISNVDLKGRHEVLCVSQAVVEQDLIVLGKVSLRLVWRVGVLRQLLVLVEEDVS